MIVRITCTFDWGKSDISAPKSNANAREGHTSQKDWIHLFIGCYG